jgi:hypothetical protein
VLIGCSAFQHVIFLPSMFIFIQSFVAMRYESFLWLEDNYWGIEWLTGELLWGARPDNNKAGYDDGFKVKTELH